jgi:hypothetical protein
MTGFARGGSPVVRAAVLASILLATGCSSAADPTCVLTAGPNGSTRLQCPEGGSTVFPKTVERVPHGRITGVATFFGLEDHSGIDIRSVEAPDNTRTAADGSWALEDVVPGPYQLQVSAPAYQTVNVSRFLVLPGTAVIRPITLHLARQMLPDNVDDITLSPRRDAFLADGLKGALQLFDVKRFEVFALAAAAKNPQFTEDGAFVYLSELGNPSRLLRWDVERATFQIIDRDVTDWVLARDNRSVAYAKQEVKGPLEDLVVWQEGHDDPQIVARGVGFWQVYNGNLIAALLPQDQPKMVLIAWDIAAGAGANLGFVRDLPFEVGPDGRGFVFLNSAGQPQLYDASAGGAEDLAGRKPTCAVFKTKRCASYAPDGRSLLLTDEAGDTVVHLVTRRKDLAPVVTRDDLGARGPLAQPPQFSPDGTQVLVVHEHAIGIYDVATERTTLVIEGRPVVKDSVAFLPRGDGVVFAAPPLEDDAPAGAISTWVWTREAGTKLVAREDATRIFSPAGDALAVTGKALSFSDFDRGIWGDELSARSRPGTDFVGFSPDGKVLAFVTPDHDTGPSGTLQLLTRDTGEVKTIETYAAAGFRFTPGGDLVFIQQYVGVAGWGRLSLLTAATGEKKELSDLALWDQDHPIVVSETGARLLFHVVRPDAELRLVYMDLDEARSGVPRPIPVDTVGAQGTHPLITDQFLLYRVGGNRPGWYVSLYPAETPQGGGEVKP